MNTTNALRIATGLTVILTGCAMLSSCTSSPTYGTDKTAAEQLVDDLGSAASITGGSQKKDPVKYTPRPSLVVPPQTARTELTTPQVSVANRDNNPQWVESPEEARVRLRKEADANEFNADYKSPLLVGKGTAGQLTESQKWQAFRDARAQQKGAYTDQRRYLSDPPTEYRQVDAAAADDLGEPEEKKAARRKKEAAVAKSDSKWWMPFQ
jgi:hypothetical protein